MDYMMSRHAEESQFFDAMEHVSLASGSIDDCHSFNNREYDVWINSPQSVTERRRKFIRWMGLSSDGLEGDDFSKEDIGRIMETSGDVQKIPLSSENRFSSGHSYASIWSYSDLDSSMEVDLIDVRSDDGSESVCNVIGLVKNERNKLEPSPPLQHLVEKELFVNGSAQRTTDKLKDRLLNKLRSISCMTCSAVNDDNVRSINETRIQRVKVRYSQRRRMKKLSALFTGQDIPAHEGPILAMKFSHSGKYLASAGKDKFVRVWLVVEDDRSYLIDIPDADPSCVYFLVNNESELGPLQKDNVNESKRLKKTQDSACIIFPPKVFRILEKPLHLFQGHKGEILDLSWSKNDCLLSASIDKTVRLWRVGFDHCLKVFSHNNYVTCIQFNPLNDDYFISGSIDGKVRIWTINGCQVVDWTETKEIITAISYRPDGQGGVIGSVSGTCQFFNISDNRVQFETRMRFASKKSPCKRVTGFQFLAHDPSKVLVTCANSQVRVIDGIDVIRKYKGIRNGGNQMSASFTSDGKHIVSASQDSNVYMWNYSDPVSNSLSQPKSIRSFECFSSNASVVIPWPGLKVGNSENELKSRKYENSKNSLPFSLSAYFSSGGQEFFLDSNPKGSTTWPEEKLPVSYPRDMMSSMCKSQYKLLKACCQSTPPSSHAWGLVLVTASWDGKIRSFHNYGLPVPH